MAMKSDRKVRIPFYMRTKRIRPSMLPIKDIVFSYNKNPRSVMPTVAELNIAFGSIYSQIKDSYKKELMKIDADNKTRNITPLHIRRSLQAERQQRYQKIFCTPKWTNSYWNTLNEASTSHVYRRNLTIQRRLEKSFPGATTPQSKVQPKKVLSTPKSELVKPKLGSIGRGEMRYAYCKDKFSSYSPNCFAKSRKKMLGHFT
eukprot:TRINITY_DN4327_c0_g1_i1.p1 TRINITY_DN4327_c0_g1~~TRINITY_DN4327_c0_g1_i1.p1  ORF type:complete len:202 (+),score=37.43 TRINITY_DN4327_c0_g1_i1:1973-2578(+)